MVEKLEEVVDSKDQEVLKGSERKRSSFTLENDNSREEDSDTELPEFQVPSPGKGRADPNKLIYQ